MILDSLLDLGGGQSTTNAASPDIIDTLAAGEAVGNAILYVHVPTAFAAAEGTPYGSFELQSSETSDFGGYTVLAASGTFAAASLTAGKEIKLPIGADAARYIRGYFKSTDPNGETIEGGYSGGHGFSATGYHFYIVKDVNASSVI
jgi:hypothetical protein